MPSRIVWISAAATGATIVVAGAAAAYWTHPGYLWPNPGSAVVANRPSERPASSRPAAPTNVADPEPSVAHPEPSTAAAAPDAAAPPTTAVVPGAAPQSVKPAFDVVTVEPTGEAVVAGRAAPNAEVELRDAGQKVAGATTDATGQFVIIPPALAPGGHSLSLATHVGQPQAQTSNTIAVSVPAPAVVGPANSGAASKTPAATPPTKSAALQSAAPAATPLATPSPAAASRVAIQSVEALAGGGLVAKGAADADSVVRFFINGAFVADARTKADGRWSLTVRRGIAPGPYVVRAEEANPGAAKVVASAEAAFDYPASPPAQTVAASPAPDVVGPKPTAPAPAVASASPPTAAPAATPLATSPPAAASRVAIQSVEALAGGGLAAKGAADADSVVRFFINGAFVADARTKADGRWSLTVQRGIAPGPNVARAEEANPGAAKVVASAEAAFDYPAAPASSPPAQTVAASPAPDVLGPKPMAPAPAVASASPPTAAPLAASSAADVVVDSIQTDRVVRGDTLWGISRMFYGDGRRYPLIFGANTNQIHNPNRIYPGENLVVPKTDAKP